MNVDMMRKIDYYAGIPLCFISTYILKLFKKPKKEPKKVLLIELSEMGSAILVDPMLKELQKRGCELHFLIFKKNAVSLKLLNTIPEDNIFTIDAESMSGVVKDSFRFLKWAREKDIDSTIDLELFSRYSALLSGFSGASNVVGFHKFRGEGLYRGDMLTKKVAYNPHIHISQNFYSLLHALFSPKELPYSKVKTEIPELDKAVIKDEDRYRVLSHIKKLVGSIDEKEIVLVNANASDLLPQRRWDRRNFCEVIKELLKNPKHLVLLTGSPEEREELDDLKKCVANDRCINFAGEVKFLDLLTLYDVSKFMLTNDSGPTHFASVTKLHTFVIFGPETPALYGSLGSSTPIYAHLNCSPCVSATNHRNTPCVDNVCIQVITPKIVIETIKEKFPW